MDDEEVAALRRRVRELETVQRLIQRELDSVSDAATRADSQLRCPILCHVWKREKGGGA